MKQGRILEARAKQELLESMGPLHDAMNKILEKIFPQYAKLLGDLRKALSNDPLINQALTNLRSLYTSLTYHAMRQTALHADSKNPLYGIEALVVLGDFCKGGYFIIPELGLKLRALPGTIIFFRANAFEHGVLPWEKGKCRLSVAHYVSQAVVTGHLGVPLGGMRRKEPVDCGVLREAGKEDGDMMLWNRLQNDYRGYVAQDEIFIGPSIELDVYQPPH